METSLQNETVINPPRGKTLKIFGVGTAGINILQQVAQNGLSNASLIAVNTDAHAFANSSASEKICIESKLTSGLGTGGDPDRGRAAAEEQRAVLKAACAGVDVVFIVAGLGGGAGTGISPVLAQAAKEAGALVLAFTTLPFDCEGNRRQRQALEGLQALKGSADGVICLPSQKLLRLIDENTRVLDTFKLSNELLAEGVASVWRLVHCQGLIEIHFDDLCSFLRDRHGESYFATAEAAGATRSREAIDKLFAHPMLDGGKGLAEAEAVLVSIIAGTDLTMGEINRVMEHINGKCAHAQVMMGAAVNADFQDRLAITIVASRSMEMPAVRMAAKDFSLHETAPSSEELDTQFHRAPSARPQSRFVPPPPTMSPEKMEQLASRQAGSASRGRKAVARLRQTQLPLEIVSKGRFDKSEPTIHKGEDLDVPTYIRRGVALN